MATKREQKCPDCLYEFMERTDKGSGKCRNCEGAGEASDPMDSFTEAATLGLTKADNICKKCSGTGQCQTCGGTGYVYYYESDVPTSQTSSSSGGGVQGLLINIFGQEKGILYYRIGFLGIFAAVVYFMFTVAIPLIVINTGIISLLLGVVKKGKSKFLFSLSTLGMLFLILDYNKGWLTKILPANAPSFKGSISFFFYLNIAAGLVAAYFLIRNYLNEKQAPAENEGEFSKRNLIVIGCLVLVGGLTIGLQKYFDLHDSNEIHSIDNVAPSNSELDPTNPNVSDEESPGNVGRTHAGEEELLLEIDNGKADNSTVGSTHAGEEGEVNAPNSNPNAFSKTVNVKRAYFYDFVQGKFEKRNPELFVIRGDKVTILDSQNGYANIKYSTKNGANVTGWLLEADLNGVNSTGIIPGRFPEASVRLLSEGDFSAISKEDLKVMRNEIFARHGFVFKTPEMKSYFATQSWYHGQYDDVTPMLSSIEKQNIALIKKHE